tara:strand:+ start:5484 stop:5639 length:156 start_codon:yes stop_codon:yes gene_type:complete
MRVRNLQNRMMLQNQGGYVDLLAYLVTPLAQGGARLKQPLAQGGSFITVPN